MIGIRKNSNSCKALIKTKTHFSAKSTVRSRKKQGMVCRTQQDETNFKRSLSTWKPSCLNESSSFFTIKKSFTQFSLLCSSATFGAMSIMAHSLVVLSILWQHYRSMIFSMACLDLSSMEGLLLELHSLQASFKSPGLSSQPFSALYFSTLFHYWFFPTLVIFT